VRQLYTLRTSYVPGRTTSNSLSGSARARSARFLIRRQVYSVWAQTWTFDDIGPGIDRNFMSTTRVHQPSCDCRSAYSEDEELEH